MMVMKLCLTPACLNRSLGRSSKQQH